MVSHFNNKTLVTIVCLLGLLLTSCGNSKSAQCSKLADSVLDSIKTYRKTNGEQNAVKLNSFADTFEQYAREADQLPINDPKLQDFRSRLTTIYRSVGERYRTLAIVRQQNNPAGTSKTAQALTEDLQQQVLLVKELKSYCNQ